MSIASTQLFWITSRGAGLAALILAGVSVAVGASIRSPRTARGPGGDRRTLHESLSLATLMCLGVHGAALLGDGWLHPGLSGVTVPFTSSYRPFWTGLGIVGGYALGALGLSYYARSRIGPARWNTAHRFVALFWALGIVHALGAGTDAGRPRFLITVGAATVPALLILANRVVSLPRLRPVEAPE